MNTLVLRILVKAHFNLFGRKPKKFIDFHFKIVNFEKTDNKDPEIHDKIIHINCIDDKKWGLKIRIQRFQS